MVTGSESLCAVVDCEEPGGPYPLTRETDPRREVILCPEHSTLASAGAQWLARTIIGGELAVYMEESLPPRLHALLEEDALSSEGACSRILLQLIDGEGKLTELSFRAPRGWSDHLSRE